MTTPTTAALAAVHVYYGEDSGADIGLDQAAAILDAITAGKIPGLALKTYDGTTCWACEKCSKTRDGRGCMTCLASERDAAVATVRQMSERVSGEDRSSSECPFCAMIGPVGSPLNVPMCRLCYHESERDNRIEEKNAALALAKKCGEERADQLQATLLQVEDKHRIGYALMADLDKMKGELDSALARLSAAEAEAVNLGGVIDKYRASLSGVEAERDKSCDLVSELCGLLGEAFSHADQYGAPWGEEFVARPPRSRPMSDAILPCPFCGNSDDVLVKDDAIGHKHEWIVTCDALNGCPGATVRWFKTEAEAIAAWNTRTPASVPVTEEAVERALHRYASLLQSGHEREECMRAALLASGLGDGAGWVKTKTRLPQDGYRCLAYIPGCYGVEHVEFRHGYWRDVHGAEGVSWFQNEATHWMPLPSPPAAGG